MKVTIREIDSHLQEQIIIECHEVTPEIAKIVYKLKDTSETIVGYDEGNIYRINTDSIYYIESVDNKVFIYCEKDIYESHEKLYQIEETLGEGDFFRASKSVIINISKIDYVKPALNGRFEAILKSKEKLIISRQYVPELKKRLGI